MQTRAGATHMPRPCVVCGCTKVVDSHLLPRAIFLDLKSNSKHTWVGSFEKPGKQIIQGGIFDRFLCDDHERKLHADENYGIKFIRKFPLSGEELQQGFFHPVCCEQ